MDESALQLSQTTTHVIPDNLAWIKTVCDDIDLFVFQVCIFKQYIFFAFTVIFHSFVQSMVDSFIN